MYNLENSQLKKMFLLFQDWARAASSPRPREVPGTRPGFARTLSNFIENVKLSFNGRWAKSRGLHSGDPFQKRWPINGPTFWDDFAFQNVLEIYIREHCYNKYFCVFGLIKLDSNRVRFQFIGEINFSVSFNAHIIALLCRIHR